MITPLLRRTYRQRRTGARRLGSAGRGRRPAVAGSLPTDRSLTSGRWGVATGGERRGVHARRRERPPGCSSRSHRVCRVPAAGVPFRPVGAGTAPAIDLGPWFARWTSDGHVAREEFRGARAPGTPVECTVIGGEHPDEPGRDVGPTAVALRHSNGHSWTRVAPTPAPVGMPRSSGYRPGHQEPEAPARWSRVTG